MMLTKPAKYTGYGSEEWIASARKHLEPIEVRLNHFPKQMKQRCRDFFRAIGRKMIGGWNPAYELCQVIRCGTEWIDHWGSMKAPWDDVPDRLFVAEPYLMVRGIHDAELFAQATATHLRICSNSWWYPGQTTRLMFVPPQCDDETEKLKKSQSLLIDCFKDN